MHVVHFPFKHISFHSFFVRFNNGWTNYFSAASFSLQISNHLRCSLDRYIVCISFGQQQKKVKSNEKKRETRTIELFSGTSETSCTHTGHRHKARHGFIHISSAFLHSNNNNLNWMCRIVDTRSGWSFSKNIFEEKKIWNNDYYNNKCEGKGIIFHSFCSFSWQHGMWRAFWIWEICVACKARLAREMVILGFPHARRSNLSEWETATKYMNSVVRPFACAICFFFLFASDFLFLFIQFINIWLGVDRRCVFSSIQKFVFDNRVRVSIETKSDRTEYAFYFYSIFNLIIWSLVVHANRIIHGLVDGNFGISTGMLHRSWMMNK